MKKILVMDPETKRAEKLANMINKRIVYWAPNFVQGNFCFNETNFDIVVINVEIESGWSQVEAIEKMAKKSKIIVVSSALLYVSSRDFHLYSEENNDNIIVVGNEKEAIQKVLDCLKE